MSSTRLGFLARPWSTSSRSTAATALLVVSHGWKCTGTGATDVQAAAQVAFISSSANFSAVVSLSFIPQLPTRESADALRCRSRRRRTPRRAGRVRGSSLPALLAAPSTGAWVVETSGVRHLRSQFLQGNQPRFQGVNGGLCPVPDTDTLVELLHVVPDGLHTQVHFLCDLGVMHATRDTAENGEVAPLQTNTGCVHFSSPLKIRWTSSGSWTEFV